MGLALYEGVRFNREEDLHYSYNDARIHMLFEGEL